jgi:hypothetical protein
VSASTKYPTKFFGKTWIYQVQFFVLGLFAIFSLTMGVLFHFRIIKPADGRKDVSTAVIALLSIGAGLLPVVGTAIFNIAARRRPIFRICREGIEIRSIGDSKIKRMVFLPKLVRVVLLIVTLQAFRAKILRISWDRLSHIDATGIPMDRYLIVLGDIRVYPPSGVDEALLVAQQYTFPQVAFKMPLENVVDAVKKYAADPSALESWND